jgi:hypothetical protein
LDYQCSARGHGKQEISLSYSFSKSAATAAAVLALVSDEMQAIVIAQPPHEADAPLVLKTVEDTLALMAVDANSQVHVSVSGSIWKAEDGVRQIGVHVNAHLSKNPVVVEPAPEAA